MDITGELFYYAQSGESAIENVTRQGFDGISINAANISKEQIAEAPKSQHYSYGLGNRLGVFQSEIS